MKVQLDRRNEVFALMARSTLVALFEASGPLRSHVDSADLCLWSSSFSGAFLLWFGPVCLWFFGTWAVRFPFWLLVGGLACDPHWF